MKSIIFLGILAALSFYSFSQDAEIKTNSPFTLEKAINLALENNYDIQNQNLAVEEAKAQFKKVKGNLDIEAGVQAHYSMKQNPVDKEDPDYAYGRTWFSPGDYGIYSDNTTVNQTAGTIYLRKLFGFGLETKLSYTVERNKSNPEYTYSKDFKTENYSKYKEEEARNNGELSLELSLPLFKSFKNSISALQIEAAKDYLEQMESNLKDTIAKTIIDVSVQYWNYILSYKNMENLEILQKKIQQRNANMDSMIKAGVRSKNDLLALQVNENENRRMLQEAKVQYNNAKMALAKSMGITEADFISKPENTFSQIDFASLNPPERSDLNEEFFSKIEENRADIKALKKQLSAAEKNVRLYKAEALPDTSLNFGIGTTGAVYSDSFGDTLISGFKNIPGVNLTGAIGINAKIGNNTKKGQLNQAEAEYASRLNSYTQAKNSLKLEILNASQKLDIYKALVTDADDVLKLQKTLYENEQKKFNAGLLTVDNLLNQDQRYLSAETSYYQVLINYLQSILEFKYFTGELVE